jgi:hypothetical protein
MSQRRPARRYVYLLRIWEERADDPDGAVYRFSLEEARSHERYGFSDLERLIAFLNALAEPDGAAPDGGRLPPGGGLPPTPPEHGGAR